jgi:dolichol-phosphate mannosyltransferase
MVNGVRARRHDGLVRKVSSRVANGFRNWLTSESVADVGCSMRVFRREVVQGLPSFRGMHRFLPTLVRLRGGTFGEVPVHHRPRLHGRTKYGINNRLWVGLLDSFGVRWLQGRWVEPKVRLRGGGAEEEATRRNRVLRVPARSMTAPGGGER